MEQCWTVTPRPFPHWRLAFGPSWTEFVYLGCCSILIMVQQVRKLTLGLTLSTPGLVLFIFYTLRQLCTSHINLLLSVKLADILSLSLYWVLFWWISGYPSIPGRNLYWKSAMLGHLLSILLIEFLRGLRFEFMKCLYIFGFLSSLWI